MKLLLFFLCLILIIASVFPQVLSQQDVVSLDLSQHAWAQTELRVLLITEENQSWWKPYFIDLSQNAVNQWDDAIQFFAEKYPNYPYLSQVKLILDVSDQNLSSYNIYIMFREELFINGKEAMGLATIFPSKNGTIEKCIINLSTKSGPLELTRSDKRDVAVHELGHALGLAHSNSSNDLMYPYYDIYSTTNAISTLNLYGIAVLFGSITDADRNQTPKYITLPQDIPYEYAPVSNPAPQTPSDNPLAKTIMILLSNSYTLVMAGSLLIFVIIIGIVYKISGKPKRHNLSIRARLIEK